jgi:hypothetical protein
MQLSVQLEHQHRDSFAREIKSKEVKKIHVRCQLEERKEEAERNDRISYSYSAPIIFDGN